MSLITDNTTAFKALLIELGEKPILAQTLTMSAFCGLGDFLAQTNSMRTSSTSVCYDWKRVAKFACKGIGCGIIWSHWFMLAEIWSTTLTVWILQQHHVDVKLFAIVRTIVNLLLEQFIACPLIFGLWDLPIISLMDGKPLIKIPGIVRQKLIKLLIANAKLWTVANVVIYNAPLNLRVLLVSLADLFWESIVSTVACSILSSRMPAFISRFTVALSLLLAAALTRGNAFQTAPPAFLASRRATKAKSRGGGPLTASHFH